METSNKHKPLQHRDSLYRDTCTIPLSKYTGGPPQVAGISRKPGQTKQEIEGKDSPHVRHLPTQETPQRAMLMQGANSKPVEVVGLQLTRPKLSETLERKPNKTGASQNSTR
jgi:hypothetical protein